MRCSKDDVECRSERIAEEFSGGGRYVTIRVRRSSGSVSRSEADMLADVMRGR